MRSWRKMTWALIAWSVLMAIWVIGGANAADCAREADGASKAGCQVGAGLGAGLLVVLWFLGFIVLALIWLMTRPRDQTGVAAASTAPPAPPAPGWHPDPQGDGHLRWWDGRGWTEHTNVPVV